MILSVFSVEITVIRVARGEREREREKDREKGGGVERESFSFLTH